MLEEQLATYDEKIAALRTADERLLQATQQATEALAQLKKIPDINVIQDINIRNAEGIAPLKKGQKALMEDLNKQKQCLIAMEAKNSALRYEIELYSFLKQAAKCTVSLAFSGVALFVAIHTASMMLMAIAATAAAIGFTGSAYGLFTLKLPSKSESNNGVLAVNPHANPGV